LQQREVGGTKPIIIIILIRPRDLSTRGLRGLLTVMVEGLPGHVSMVITKLDPIITVLSHDKVNIHDMNITVREAIVIIILR